MLMLLFSCLSDLSFFISYPPLLILLRPYSCSSTPTLLLLSYSWLLTRTLLLLLFYSFAVILILPTPSLLLLLDYSPCVYSCSPIAIVAFAFSCSYSLPPTLLFLSFKE